MNAGKPTAATGGRGPAVRVRRVGSVLLAIAALTAAVLGLKALSEPGQRVGSAQSRAHQAGGPGGSPAHGAVTEPAATTPHPRPVRLSVAIDARHPRARVPADFLGLSFELSMLHQLGQYGDRGDLAGLLRSLGPGVLRFGGISADTRTAWTDPTIPRPAWASGTVEASDFRALARLASSSGWHVLLTIGLAHYDVQAAAHEATAAKVALGPWLAGVELGNEPNAYARHGLRPEPWTFARYREEVLAYRRAISSAAPGIPLAGPDVSGSQAFLRWGPDEVRQVRPALLTGHHYPLGCHGPPTATVSRLLSVAIRRKEDSSLLHYVSVARAGRIPFRMDETNSVSCGGRAGVSNTFASALWALDYITKMMAAGIAGVNFQGNPANCAGYAPFCAQTPEQLAKGALRAQPEWYALLLASTLVGDRPVRSVVSRAGHTNIDVATLLLPDHGLHVVVVNDDPPGSPPAVVKLHVGRGFAEGHILALTAPAATAGVGVTLGGAVVGRSGSWRPRSLPGAPDRGGVITLSVSPAAALLVTVPRAKAPPA